MFAVSCLVTVATLLKLTTIQAAPSCVTLSRTFEAKLLNPCAAVVDYPFYLPASHTLAQLEEKANHLLGNVSIKVSPTSCQEALRNAACASIYLKCVPDVNLLMVSTWSNNIYGEINVNFPLPFQRPCVSVCEEIPNSCTGLYQVANPDYPDCNEIFDYSAGQYTAAQPYKYDRNSSSGQCFVPRLDQRIAESKEVYNFANSSGMCAGLVETTFAPPGSKIAPQYAVLLEPFAAQRLIEEEVRTSLAKLPHWLASDCHLALLRHICGSVFLRAETKTMAVVFDENGLSIHKVAAEAKYSGLMQMPVTLPSYPRRDICLDFQAKCSAVIRRANNSALTPNCSADLVPDTATGAHKYPAKQQIVASTMSALLGPINFYTAPNNMSHLDGSRYSYAQSCPDGFVVPEHPNNTYNRMVGDTGCAPGCKVKVWTDEEWSSFERQSVVVPIVGAVLSAVLIVLYCFTYKDLRDNYLVLLFSLLSFAASVASGVLNNRPFEDRFCFDNSINTSQHVEPYSLCVVQGVVLVYVLLASCAITFCMILDAYLKLNEYHVFFDRPAYVLSQLVFVLGLPLIPVIYAGYHELFGFSKTQPYCFIMAKPYAPEDIDIGIVALPILVVTFFTLLLFVVVVGSLCCGGQRKANNRVIDGAVSGDEEEAVAKEEVQGGSEDRPVWHRHSRENILYHTVPAIAFVGVMFSIWFAFIASKGVLYASGDAYLDSFKAWSQCLFENWFGDWDHATSVCGLKPGKRPGRGLVTWLIVCLTGKSLVVAVVYLPVYTMRCLYPAPKEVVDDLGGAKGVVRAVEVKEKPVLANSNSSNGGGGGAVNGGGGGGGVEMIKQQQAVVAMSDSSNADDEGVFI